MLPKKRYHRQRGQTRREVVLILLVCAVALLVMLSVFIPGVRRAWVALGRGVLGYQGSRTAAVVPPESTSSSLQERK